MGTKKKTYYTVIVSIRSGLYARQYVYLNVTRYYKENGLLVIKTVEKATHRFELSRIENIQVRDYQKGAVQWG